MFCPFWHFVLKTFRSHSNIAHSVDVSLVILQTTKYTQIAEGVTCDDLIA
jgi:hypothetical protein